MSRVNRAITASDERVHLVALYDFFLDDAGLNPFEYRAYMRIVRRAGGGRSACTESLENMAIGCRMSRRAMVGAIKALIKRHMIRRESKSGHVSTYVLTDKSTWVLDETTWAPDAQVEGEGWALYAQGVGTICPQRIQIRIQERILRVRELKLPHATLTTIASQKPMKPSLTTPIKARVAILSSTINGKRLTLKELMRLYLKKLSLTTWLPLLASIPLLTSLPDLRPSASRPLIDSESPWRRRPPPPVPPPPSPVRPAVGA